MEVNLRQIKPLEQVTGVLVYREDILAFRTLLPPRTLLAQFPQHILPTASLRRGAAYLGIYRPGKEPTSSQNAPYFLRTLVGRRNSVHAQKPSGCTRKASSKNWKDNLYCVNACKKNTPSFRTSQTQTPSQAQYVRFSSHVIDWSCCNLVHDSNKPLVV